MERCEAGLKRKLEKQQLTSNLIQLFIKESGNRLYDNLMVKSAESYALGACRMVYLIPKLQKNMHFSA